MVDGCAECWRVVYGCADVAAERKHWGAALRQKEPAPTTPTLVGLRHRRRCRFPNFPFEPSRPITALSEPGPAELLSAGRGRISQIKFHQIIPNHVEDSSEGKFWCERNGGMDSIGPGCTHEHSPTICGGVFVPVARSELPREMGVAPEQHTLSGPDSARVGPRASELHSAFFEAFQATTNPVVGPQFGHVCIARVGVAQEVRGQVHRDSHSRRRNW